METLLAQQAVAASMVTGIPHMFGLPAPPLPSTQVVGLNRNHHYQHIPQKISQHHTDHYRSKNNYPNTCKVSMTSTMMSSNTLSSISSPNLPQIPTSLNQYPTQCINQKYSNSVNELFNERLTENENKPVRKSSDSDEQNEAYSPDSNELLLFWRQKFLENTFTACVNQILWDHNINNSKNKEMKSFLPPTSKPITLSPMSIQPSSPTRSTTPPFSPNQCSMISDKLTSDIKKQLVPTSLNLPQSMNYNISDLMSFNQNDTTTSNDHDENSKNPLIQQLMSNHHNHQLPLLQSYSALLKDSFLLNGMSADVSGSQKNLFKPSETVDNPASVSSVSSTSSAVDWEIWKSNSLLSVLNQMWKCHLNTSKIEEYYNADENKQSKLDKTSCHNINELLNTTDNKDLNNNDDNTNQTVFDKFKKPQSVKSSSWIDQNKYPLAESHYHSDEMDRMLKPRSDSVTSII
ncbi:unnamed protein product [Trichobilharzia regenti]|nr:unnamed protein product [Trichobilharzia regenti]